MITFQLCNRGMVGLFYLLKTERILTFLTARHYISQDVIFNYVICEDTNMVFTKWIQQNSQNFHKNSLYKLWIQCVFGFHNCFIYLVYASMDHNNFFNIKAYIRTTQWYWTINALRIYILNCENHFMGFDNSSYDILVHHKNPFTYNIFSCLKIKTCHYTCIYVQMKCIVVHKNTWIISYVYKRNKPHNSSRINSCEL